MGVRRGEVAAGYVSRDVIRTSVATRRGLADARDVVSLG